MPNNEAPIRDKVVDDNSLCRSTWAEFFDTVVRGDVGDSFTPVFANLGSTGTPTITGVYYQNQGFTDFAVKIVPATDTSSTFGTTSFVLPFSVRYDTGCDAVAGITVARGVINANSKTVYPPTWSALTVPITISGRVKS